MHQRNFKSNHRAKRSRIRSKYFKMGKIGRTSPGRLRPMAWACRSSPVEKQLADRPMPMGEKRGVIVRSPRCATARWRSRCGSPVASQPIRSIGRASPSFQLDVGHGRGVGDSTLGWRNSEERSRVVRVVLVGGGGAPTAHVSSCDKVRRRGR
jgi:hypothetical protein